MAARTAQGRSPRFTDAVGSRVLKVVVVGVAVLVLVGALTLMYGAVTLSPSEAWGGLTSESNTVERAIVWQIRYPRWLDGVLVGASLAVAGALLQGVTRNPLADPTILGLSGAAGLASSIMIVANPQIAQWGIAMAAMAGGVVGSGVLFIVAYRGAISPVRLALAGVAISAFFGAAIVALLHSSRTFLQTNLSFLAGGLYGAEWGDFQAALPYALPALGAAMLVSGRLNVLALGEEMATGLGVLTDRTRMGILLISGILVAVAVSIAGLVSFVGLLCPHVARYTVGSDYRKLVPVAGIFGAVLVTGADLLAKLVLHPSEIPMGIITAVIGAPFLLYLVRFRT